MSGFTEIAWLRYELELLRKQIAAKDEVIAEAGEMLAMRDRQLAALKAELREICAAIDDPACDLTLTAVECIKKLKADNENLKRDAEQWRAYQKRKQDLLDRGFLRSPLREEAELNPAMTQGEK